MINNICYNKYCNPQFGAKWVNGNKVTVHKRQGASMLEELIKKMVEELKTKAENAIKKDEPFDVLWSEIELKDKAIDATHCLLKISPTGVKGSENNKYLEVAALKSGCPYGAETVIGYGSSKDILDKLNEQGIEQVVKENFLRLAENLRNI